MVDPAVFQIAGYQNRGKTTLITSLIKRLNEQRYETAVLKHHGHGGLPDIPDHGGKDSEKHFAAGASASMVEGGGTILLQAETARRGLNSLPAMLGVLRFFEPHVILIEGYKQEIFPKAVLVRSEDDLKLIEELPNIQAVIAWPERYERARQLFNPEQVFLLGDEQFFDWFIESYLPAVL